MEFSAVLARLTKELTLCGWDEVPRRYAQGTKVFVDEEEQLALIEGRWWPVEREEYVLL